MGFLGDLFKKEAKKFVSDIVDKAVDSITGDMSNTEKDKNNASDAVKVKTSISESDSVFDKIKYIVANEFTDYELKENINSSELGALSGAAPYTYGIYRNSAPVIMINVYTDRNEYKLKKFRLAKEAAEFSGVTHLNFFSHLPNEITYITERLRDNM